jgi:hypothetical protein
MEYYIAKRRKRRRRKNYSHTCTPHMPWNDHKIMMLREESYSEKGLHMTWFYLFIILENTNSSMTGSRSIVPIDLLG